MNVDQYFRTRADLVARALAERQDDEVSERQWRFYAAGLLCISGSMAVMVWSATTFIDAGFFARTTAFLSLVLFAGIWLLTIAQLAHVLLARDAVRSRDSLREKTLSQLLKIDGSIAHKALQRPL